CAPQTIIKTPSSVQVIEGQTINLEFSAASGINLNSVSNGIAHLNNRDVSYSWYYYHRSITIPNYSQEAEPELSDGGTLAVKLSGQYADEPLVIGNDLSLQVFIPEADFDNDGLSNAVEVQYAGLDPTNADSDGDGIDDAADDLDHDGLINSDEIINNTLLNDGDTDNDNLSDGDEVNVYNSNPHLSDTDGDGLSDGSEVNANPSSSPTLLDTDADGINDNIEVQYGLNPNDASDANADADNDGLSNLQEVQNNTFIDIADSDGDTLLDGAEVNANPATNPLDPDTDNDGLDDNLDYDPVVPDVVAPVLTLTSPDLAQSYLTGQQVTFEVDATDLGRVTQVFYRINNVQQPSILTVAPYRFSIVLPTDAESIVFEALAVDSNDNQGTTGSLAVTVIEDPLTTVVGTVLDVNSLPIEGVTITVNNLETISLADGSFTLPNVPVAPGDITALANIVINGANFIGASATTSPVYADVTNVGQIQLIIDEVTVGYLNNRYNQGQEYQRLIIENAGMEAVQITDLSSFDLSSIDMLMFDNNRWLTGNNTSTTYYLNRHKVFDWVSSGGTLLFHENQPNSYSSIADDLLPNVPASISSASSTYYIYPFSTANKIASGPGGDFMGFYIIGQIYGSAALDSLIPEATPLVYNGQPYQGYITGFDYPWQQGRIYYSTVRLEGLSTSSATHTQYAPNMLQAMFSRSLVDTDADGLPNRLEIVNGTNITSADTDGDGMNDAYEVRYGFNPLLDNGEALLDSDDDGVINSLESQYGSHPLLSDSDNDGLSDGDEINHSLPSDPTMMDTDFDGLTDSEERDYGTDPNNTDTDGDLLTDRQEIFDYDSNPLLLDSDGDGLSDIIEVNNGLNPAYGYDAYEDLDADGLTTRDEILLHGTDYDNADTDNDGLNDGDEIASGADPFDPDSDDDGILDGADTQVLIADITAPVIELISPTLPLNAVSG
ncbi:MAG: hypothetical protein GY814_07470, partial [Gammaproteobacteria bacterium]|nr:hypothetical protein [Gammaproteobacteria bacterium]